MAAGGIADSSVDVAFDKSTLDAMIFGSPWNPPAEVRENTARYLGEVSEPASFQPWKASYGLVVSVDD